jgi:hypothetical protein
MVELAGRVPVVEKFDLADSEHPIHIVTMR